MAFIDIKEQCLIPGKRSGSNGEGSIKVGEGRGYRLLLTAVDNTGGSSLPAEGEEGGV